MMAKRRQVIDGQQAVVAARVDPARAAAGAQAQKVDDSRFKWF